jgi:hypothetical protein
MAILHWDDIVELIKYKDQESKVKKTRICR